MQYMLPWDTFIKRGCRISDGPFFHSPRLGSIHNVKKRNRKLHRTRRAQSLHFSSICSAPIFEGRSFTGAPRHGADGANREFVKLPRLLLPFLCMFPVSSFFDSRIRSQPSPPHPMPFEKRQSLKKKKEPGFEKSGSGCKIQVCETLYTYSLIIRHSGAVIKSNFHLRWKP